MDRWRSPTTLDGGGPEFVRDGRRVVSFASNDYLGLSQHPAVVGAAHEAIDRWGAGTGASRLIVGTRPVHAELEAELAAWRGEEAAIVLPTGFAANLAVVSTFGGGARILSDELNHASIIDGCRLSRGDVHVYRHGDVDEVAKLLAEADRRALVVTDAVFSMDGDVAPLAELSSLCARHDALLVVDDAHAVFPLPALDPDAACLRVGTMSKTLGAMGGFVTGPRRALDLLVNRARPYIFTTAAAPAVVASALAAVGVMRSAEGAALVRRLRALVDQVRPGHPSPIVPVVLGDEALALRAAADLLAQGLLVPAIRPPTVPAGTSRLRVTLSAAHRDEDVRALVAALDRLPRPT